MKPPCPIANILAATAHGSLIVNRHDYRELGDGRGYGVGWQLLNSSSFDAQEVGNVLQLLAMRRAKFGDGVFAIDCGANIGVHTVEWAKHMHGWGQVLAFEAQERVFYSLAGNIALNNCFNARALWAAVGERAGSIQVPQPDYFQPSSFGSLELRRSERTEFIGQDIDYSEGAGLETRLLALDDLALPRVDLIKIDIEGMELEALRGARATLARCKPVMLIEHIKSDGDGLRAFLEALGYEVHALGINFLAMHRDDPGRAQLTVTRG